MKKGSGKLSTPFKTSAVSWWSSLFCLLTLKTIIHRCNSSCDCCVDDFSFSGYCLFCASRTFLVSTCGCLALCWNALWLKWATVFTTSHCFFNSPSDHSSNLDSFVWYPDFVPSRELCFAFFFRLLCNM